MPLQLDPSAKVPIDRIRAGKSFGFTATFEAPITGTWTIGFYKTDAETNAELLLVQGTDFSISGSVITVYVTAARNTLKSNCFFRVNQASGTAKVLAFQGPVTVLP